MSLSSPAPETSTSVSESLTSRAVLEEGALKSNPDLIEATRQEQASGTGHHHRHTMGEAFSEEHRALQRAGFEGPQGPATTVIAQNNVGASSGSQSAQAGSSQLHDHILSLALSSTKKKKEAVTDDAEMAEFVRQHPELSQYIKQLQEARDTALQKAQQGKQSGLESAANLNAKLDTIATLLEGSPIAPALRMGDTVAKEAFIQESKKAFEDADEGAALAEYAWNRAQELVKASDQKKAELVSAGEKQLNGSVDQQALSKAAQILASAPADAPQAVRELRNSLEKSGVDLNRALDPSTPEGAAFERMIDKNSPNPDVARQLKTLLFAAQLRADCHETSSKLAPEAMVDRFLAMDPKDRKLVDTYFRAISEKSADRYLLEAYMNIRAYKREEGSTILAREPVENREAIVSKLVLNRAAAEGMEVKFVNGQLADEWIFRKTIEKVFDTKFGTNLAQHPLILGIGGIQNLDNFDNHMRMQAVSSALSSVSTNNVELTGTGLAEHRAQILTDVLPIALATDRQTKINMAPQFVGALEAIPDTERRELLGAYQKKTGMALDQAVRSYASAPVADATLNSLFVLFAADSATTTELIKTPEIQAETAKLGTAVQGKDPAELSNSARALHDSLCAAGISVNRALDSTLDEGKVFDAHLREQLKDDALVRQAKAAIFAVELERQAGPNSATLPSQGMVGYFLGLPKDEKAVVEQYFKGVNAGSTERYLFEAFSGAQRYQPLNWEMSDQRAARPDAKQIIAALLVSSAEQRGQALQLKDGQLTDPAAPENEIRAMYSNEPSKDRVESILKNSLPVVVQPNELTGLCRQALMIQTLQSLDNGSSQTPAAEVDRKNAQILATNLKHMLAADPNTGGNLATPLISFLSELPPERRLGLRDEYQKQTGHDLVADIRSGMSAHDPAQVDYVTGSAAMVLGRDDYERSAGFIAQSVAKTGKLTPQTFADIMRGLDADGCLKGDPNSVARLDKTIAAYEKFSGEGETFAKLLQRNEVPPALVDALRTGDRAVIDACNIRATLKGSGNPIQELHQLLGGEFNLNSRPELAAAYERTFGEKFGDVREQVVLAAAKEYREDVERRRRTIDVLRKSGDQDRAQLEEHDFTAGDAAKSLIPVYGIYNAGTKFFYIWDGAYEAQAKDMARRAEDNLKLTEVYVEKASRLKEITSWTDEGSKLLKQAAELQAKGQLEQATNLDRQATVLFTKAQCRMLDIPYPTDSFEARVEAAQTLARQHADLMKSNAPAADIEKKSVEAKAAFEKLVTGPWGPHQTALVRESIKSVLEIDPSIDPRKDPKANPWAARLISNAEGTGYLDSIPASALTLTKEESQQLDEMKLVPFLREQQEREIIAQKRSQFEIESEFARNHMKPMGQRNLAMLELEQRYVHRRNMAEFQKDWAQVMDNFDRTEGQLKAVRTGVLVVGAMATGGAGLPYLLAITAGSHAVQGAGDIAAGNKTWKEAGKTFVSEGGKDLLNVAMAGGMASVMKGGQVANFLSKAAGNGVQASSFLGRTALVSRQLLVSGASGSVFGVGMEGTNIAWDTGMYHTGMSKHGVTFEEASNRLMTAGATGFVGGFVGGGSAMLRGNITGNGVLSSLGRGAVSTAEYAIAGKAAQYQVGWSPDGSFGVHNQGFDVFSTVMAVGSTYVGNKAAQGHAPGNDPSQVRSFALFQPEPGVYSTPGVRNFSVHAAELKPVTDKLGSLIGLGEVTPLDKSGIGRQAASLSAQIAQVETALKFGYEMVEPHAAESSPLLLMGGAGAVEKPAPVTPQLPAKEAPALPSGIETKALPAGNSSNPQPQTLPLLESGTSNNPQPQSLPLLESGPSNNPPPTSNSGPTAQNTPPSSPSNLSVQGDSGQGGTGGNSTPNPTPQNSGPNAGSNTPPASTPQNALATTTPPASTPQNALATTTPPVGAKEPGTPVGNAAAPVENSPSTSVGTPAEPGKATQKRFLTAEERTQLETRLAELKSQYQEGLGKAKLDKRDRAIDASADAKAKALNSTESEALRNARNEKIEIEAQLKKKGTEAVTGEERQRLEDKLRVLKEKTIPIEKEADNLTKKYKPDPSNPAEYERMNQAIRDAAKLEALGKRNGGLGDLTNDQTQRLIEAYKVLDDIKFTRKVNKNLQYSHNELDRLASQNGWCPERLQAEKALYTEKAKLKLLERTVPEGPDKALQRSMIKDQLAAAKREVGFERNLNRLVKYLGAGTPEEYAAARDYMRVRDEFIKAGASASPELSQRFNQAYQHHVAVREAAQLTAAMNAHNAKLESRLAKSTGKIDKSNAIEPLKAARREEAELDTLLRSHRKETEIVTKAHELIGKEIAAEYQKTPPGQENPRIVELLKRQDQMALWLEADKGSIRRGEGSYSKRTVSATETQTFEAARDLVQSRLQNLKTTEIPYLKSVNSHAGGKTYQRYPKVVEAAEKLALAERAYGEPLMAATEGGFVPPENPKITAARSELAEAKRLAKTDMTRVDRLARLTEQAATQKWHPDLVKAKAELIECDAAVQRTKNLPKTNEQRELAIANRDAARARVDIEKSVYKLAIKNGYGSDREIKLAREVAIQERQTNFDPEMGIADNPKYTDAVSRLNRLQAAMAQRERDTVHNRNVDAAIAARERKIDARQELPELKELRKQLERAESAYNRTGKERVSTAADKVLTEKIEDLKTNRIPRAQRADELARKYGYSTPTEIESARTIAALEQKVGIKNPTMDEIRLRLSPEEQANLSDAWSKYQGAQTESRRLAFNSKIDRATERGIEKIHEKPWIPERKLAEIQELRLQGELKKLKGNSPEVEAQRQELREQLKAHREGPLRDAQRMDFLARTRGRGTSNEVELAKKVVEAERNAKTAGTSDSEVQASQKSVDDALALLKFERNRIKVENKYVAKATKAEWTRDYSAQTLVETVVSPTTAIVVRAAAASSSGAIGNPDTPLDERVATFEAIFDRKLRADEVEFLSVVPDYMYKEVVSRVQSGWTPSRPMAELPAGQLALEGRALDAPALPSASKPRPALPAAAEPIFVPAEERNPIAARPTVESTPELSTYSPRDERELAEMLARNLETSLERGTDSRGNRIDSAQVRGNLIAQKEQIAKLLDQEIAIQRKMIEMGNDAARRGELPGGIKADPEAIKNVQRELFQEIEALDRAAERVRAETEDLRQIQRNSQSNSAARRPVSNDTEVSLRPNSDSSSDPIFEFDNDSGDNWWRNGGSAPEYNPTGGSGSSARGGGSSRGGIATRERISTSPFESTGSSTLLEPRNSASPASTMLRDAPVMSGSIFGNDAPAIHGVNDAMLTPTSTAVLEQEPLVRASSKTEELPAANTTARSRVRRSGPAMSEREIDNFMLGVDDLEGSALDAVLGHIDQTEGRTSATRAPSRSATTDPFRASASAARPASPFSGFPEREPLFQPQRQAAPEPSARVQTAVATEAPPFEFKFEIPTTSTDTALAVFTPELENHMAALSAAIDEVAPVRTTTIQAYRQPTPVIAAVDPQVATQTLHAAATSTGQLLGRLTKSVTSTDLQVNTDPQLEPKLQPEPANAKAKTKTEEVTATEKQTERRREGPGARVQEFNNDERKHELHKIEEERKKHVRELARSEKKGGAKLRFSHVVDELGDDDLIVDNEEAGG